MPRIARIITDKHPCHITQRGNNRQDVFLDDEDRKAYLTFLKALAQKYRVHVLGYCLMTNHVHLIVVPDKAAALAKAIGGTSSGIRSILIVDTAEAVICGKTGFTLLFLRIIT